MKIKHLLLALTVSLLLLSAAACTSEDESSYGDDGAYATEPYEADDEEEATDEATDEPTDEATDEGSEEEATDEPDASTGPVDDSACGVFLGGFFTEEGDSGDGIEVSGVDSETILVTYQVEGDEITNPNEESVSGDLAALQADTQAQQEIWDFFIHFMPSEQRELISEFIIFTDGSDNVLAAVDQLSTTPEAWSLEIDIADAGNRAELTYTLLHEYGHILTLNNTQFTTDGASCPYYQTDDNCTADNSYLNLFYQQFWTDIYPEWEVAEGEDALSEFYDQYSDQFLTDYAATDPDEDIAESWLYFIISPQPAGETIAEQKILFFYDFPELVDLRDEIHNNLCAYLDQ